MSDSSKFTDNFILPVFQTLWVNVVLQLLALVAAATLPVLAHFMGASPSIFYVCIALAFLFFASTALNIHLIRKRALALRVITPEGTYVLTSIYADARKPVMVAYGNIKEANVFFTNLPVGEIKDGKPQRVGVIRNVNFLLLFKQPITYHQIQLTIEGLPTPPHRFLSQSPHSCLITSRIPNRECKIRISFVYVAEDKA